MLDAAANQRFEEAAQYRDQIAKARGQAVASPQPEGKKRGRRRR
jgi:excinuclease UvrABC nuclease subunit